MKKILFLLIILVLKLNAYEILYSESNNAYSYYFQRKENELVVKAVYKDGRPDAILSTSYQSLNAIRNTNSQTSYIKLTNDNFIYYLKNDIYFLNDWFQDYDDNVNKILNYFYNENSFNNSNYINYTDYEILYNDEGLAVESIVNGVWAGLYSNDEIHNSGYLYNASGQLVYKNGLPAKFNDEFIKFMDDVFIGSVKSAFYSIAEGFQLGMVVCVFLVLGGVLLILRLLLFALQGNYSFRGSNGFRSDRGPIGDKTDYGIDESPEVLRERRQAIAGIKQKMKRNGLI